MGELTKPPLGIMPKSIWIELRVEALQQAIYRYTNAGLPVPPEWIEEYNQHVKGGA